MRPRGSSIAKALRENHWRPRQLQRLKKLIVRSVKAFVGIFGLSSRRPTLPRRLAKSFLETGASPLFNARTLPARRPLRTRTSPGERRLATRPETYSPAPPFGNRKESPSRLGAHSSGDLRRFNRRASESSSNIKQFRFHSSASQRPSQRKSCSSPAHCASRFHLCQPKDCGQRIQALSCQCHRTARRPRLAAAGSTSAAQVCSSLPVRSDALRAENASQPSISAVSAPGGTSPFWVSRPARVAVASPKLPRCINQADAGRRGESWERHRYHTVCSWERLPPPPDLVI